MIHLGDWLSSLATPGALLPRLLPKKGTLRGPGTSWSWPQMVLARDVATSLVARVAWPVGCGLLAAGTLQLSGLNGIPAWGPIVN